MPTFRPDLFAERRTRRGRLLEQLAVEVEIESTVFSEHTSEQLLVMHEFLEHQRAKRVRVHGYLLIPKGRKLLSRVEVFLASLFPVGTRIRIIQAA